MALTADFAAAVRRHGRLSAQVSDGDILAAGDIEVQAQFLPLLREAGAEYGLRRMVVPIANGRARIPDRAQVAGVRLVQWVAPGGGLEMLQQLQPEDDGGAGYGTTTPVGWYFDAGDICVVPAASSGSLLVRYYQAAPRMLLSSLVAQTSPITAVVVGTATTVTFNSGTTVSFGDVVSAAPDHRTVIPGLVSGTGNATWLNTAYEVIDRDIPVPGGDPSRTILQGDWVAPNQRTPFVPLPEELFGALVYRTAGVIQQSLGYLEEGAAAIELGERATVQALRLLTPRADGNPLTWTAGLSRSLGQGVRRWWRW